MTARQQGQFEQVQAAVGSIRKQIAEKIDVGIMLGTGLGGIVDAMDAVDSIPYSDIANFPVSTAPGHEGRLVFGRLAGQMLAVMQGRMHLFEGWTARQIALPIQVLRSLGADRLIVTNAAGALNPDYQPGQIMLVADHLNFTGSNPLAGPNDDRLGLRFPDMSDAYDRNVRKLARQCLQKLELPFYEGIYAGLLGPSLETSAERRFLRMAGADAVGMSTVTEVIAAKHTGFEVAALSAITNMAHGGPDQQPDTIAEILHNADIAGKKILQLLPELLACWPRGAATSEQ